ncbi:MAG: Caspase domain protein [candidate division BRC1 bacterium ADurb.BinA364]|nr:MAG: Caspase domain protein [candidate division BRC1 bacterium ADurb.BinA364]
MNRLMLFVAVWSVFSFRPAWAERVALLVGVDKYTHYPQFDLNGCENDARAMAELLQGKFGFRPDKTRILLSKEATAAAIEQAFREHLIEGTRPGDVALFFYSGHGSQVPDQNGDEIDDGKDEILCPTDILIGEDKSVDNVVRDDDLQRWTQALAGRETVVIFDCCHSGTGLRSFGETSRSKARYMPLESLMSPGVRSLPELARPSERNYRELEPGAAQMVTLIAACQSDEKAREASFQVNGREETHGALTVKLLKGLGGDGLGGNGKILYRDIKKYLEGPLRTHDDVQHPQYEGPDSVLDRDIFLAMSAAAPAAAVAASYSVAVEMPDERNTRLGPLRVWVDSFGAMEQGTDGPDSPDKKALLALVAAQPYLEAAGAAGYDAGLFFEQTGGSLVAGTVMRGGSVTRRETLSRIDAAALAPLLDELKRMYLVRNLEAIDNPGSPYGVDIRLLSGSRRLQVGERFSFMIKSAKPGYLTLIGIDCQGSLTLLFPNQYEPNNFVAAGEVEAPRLSGLKIVPPVGREFVKAFVCEKPLEIPVLNRQDSAGGFRTVTGGADVEELIESLIRAKTGAGAELSPATWGEDSLVFYTIE